MPSSAVDPQPRRTLTTTAKMEGLHNQQATMEAMDHRRPVAGQVIHMFTQAQKDAMVEWFRDNAFFLRPHRITRAVRRRNSL